jgi:hypothetical protein
MKTFSVALKHDAGKTNFVTQAESVESAINAVCCAEKAPRSAVLSCHAVLSPQEAKHVKTRLEHLRRQLRAERISYWELCELQSYADYIPQEDAELREAAGLPEFPE